MIDGKYIAKATGQYEFGVSDTGSENVAVEFEIIAGREAGQRLMWRGFFTEKTIVRTMEALRYCGWAGDNVTELDGIDTNPVEIVVENETYKEKVYAKIQWVNQIRGVTVKNQMDNAARDSFAKRMRGAAMAVKKDLAAKVDYTPETASAGSNDYSPPPNGHADDPGPTDQDVPF